MTKWNLSYNSVVLNLKIIQLNSLYQKREMTWSFQQVQKKCLKNLPTPFLTKTLNWLGTEGNLINLIKCIYKQTTTYIIFRGKRLDTFCLKIWNKIRMSAHHFYLILY